MSENDERSPDRWRDIVKEIVDIAQDHPKELQAAIVQGLLSRVGSTEDTPIAAEPPKGTSVEKKRDEVSEGGLKAAADDAGVSVEQLDRVIGIDEDKFRVFGTLGADAAKQRMTDIAVLYCYLNEHVRGEKTTPMPQVRDACKRDGCYDGNFSTYLSRTDDLLVEGKPGSSAKELRLAPSGVERGRQLVREMVGEA